MACVAITAPTPSSLLLLLALIFFLLASETSMATSIDRELVKRTSFAMDGDVAWVVQVSDLHISAYHKDRAGDLVRLLAPALRVIHPSLLLITGDITDAKNKKRTTTRQDISEWIQYKNTIEAIINHSGMEKQRIFDIRGNHDKYGVPFVGHELDYFSKYSVSSQLKRLSTIHSISLVADKRKYKFIGIDDSISIGIRGPSNLFGHPSDESISALKSELHQLDDSSGTLATKIVFGHFPMSFTASTQKGERYESLFLKHSVSSYICGHLHAKLSKQLWRLHALPPTRGREKGTSFWEWELGDWKESRLIRILAIDGGVVSFIDIELLNKHEVQDYFDTAILITYPTDSKSMNSIEVTNQSLRNDINALVFSVYPVVNVTAAVYDSLMNFKVVEEIPLQLVGGSVKKPLYHGTWSYENYKSQSASRYLLQVTTLDSHGKETKSELRPFSVEGKLATHSSTWLAYLFFELNWESLQWILLWSNITFLIIFLCIPKVINILMERKSSYRNWAMSVSISSIVQHRKYLFWVLWFLVEGSKSRFLWFSMLLYLFALLKVPWFCGHATSENGQVACMYINGWKIKTPNRDIGNLGSPDVMVITLPFMYLVVTPLLVLIYSLISEGSASYLHTSSKCQNVQDDLHRESDHQTQVVPASKCAPSSSRYKMCRGWIRRFLLFASLVFMLIHFKLCTVVMSAYGAGSVCLSPVMLWVPPLLLAAALISTSGTVGNKK